MLRCGVAQLLPTRLCCGKGFLSPLGDPVTLFFRDGGMNVQHERIDVRPQFGDNERDALHHQAADEVDVAAQPVQLGDDDRCGTCLAPFPSFRANFIAAASSGRRSNASAPLPVSTSRYSASIV